MLSFEDFISTLASMIASPQTLRWLVNIVFALWQGKRTLSSLFLVTSDCPSVHGFLEPSAVHVNSMLHTGSLRILPCFGTAPKVIATFHVLRIPKWASHSSLLQRSRQVGYHGAFPHHLARHPWHVEAGKLPRLACREREAVAPPQLHA